MLEIFLKKWEYKVDMFSSPLQALEHFEKNASSCSVVLTDVRMPDMSGLELAGKILRIKPDVKIILMTAFDIPPAELQAGLPAATPQDLIENHSTYRGYAGRYESVCRNSVSAVRLP